MATTDRTGMMTFDKIQMVLAGIEFEADREESHL